MMLTTGAIWGPPTIGPDKPTTRWAHYGEPSVFSPIRRKSTGDSRILLFGRIEFQRRCGPYRLSFEETAHPTVTYSVSQQMRRETIVRFWRCFLLKLPHSLIISIFKWKRAM